MHVEAKFSDLLTLSKSLSLLTVGPKFMFLWKRKPNYFQLCLHQRFEIHEQRKGPRDL